MNHFLRIYLNCQGVSRQTVRKSLLYAKDFAFKSFRFYCMRGKHPVLVSSFSLSAIPDSLSELCGCRINHRSSLLSPFKSAGLDHL